MRKYLSAIVLLLFMVAECMAQTISFKTEELKRIATELKLDGLDTLKVGSSAIPKGKYTLVVRKDGNGMVEHIGIKLFCKEYRQADNNAVLDFVENGLLYNTYKLTNNNLKYVDAKFVKGGWSTMLALTDSASFTIGKIENKVYQATWKEGKVEVVNMLIPIKYDLLLSTPRNELEHNFMRDLKAYKAKKQPAECDIDVVDLRSVKDNADTLYMLPGKSYILPTVTNTTYYRHTEKQDYQPLIDTKYPMQTIANTLLLDSKTIPEAKLEITIKASDGKDETAVVAVRQFIGFAKSQGCIPYFSFEEMRNGRFYGALFLYNKETGYDHIISLECDLKDVATDRLTFKAKAYLYTPTTNVKNLYDDIKTKKTK